MAEHARLEELIALNGELAALSRAGLPISSELARAADSLPGRSQELSRRLAGRIDSGEPLSEAIVAEADHLPPYYAALVRGGEATGRLPSALEAMSDALTRTLGLRRTVWLATLYPVLVALLSFVAMVLVLRAVGPSYDWVFQQRGEAANAFRTTRELIVRVATWAPIVLALVGIAWLAWPHRRGALAAPLGWANRLPGVGEALRLQASANYCRLLAMQLEHGTPLHEALPLSAEATGWRPFVEPSQGLSECLRAGGELNSLPEARDALPPLAVPALTSDAGAPFVHSAIESAATEYDDRARLALEAASTLLPLVATTVIGGGSLALYGVAMYGPYVASLIEITTWR